MAEIRNTFVKSKMNKDLDDRLLSKGEYRNAKNVQISRSEGEDVGALENILGNNYLNDWGLGSISNLEIIGYVVDQAKERAYFLATNYSDVSGSEIDYPAPYGASCYILLFDNKLQGSLKYKIIVQGSFLNFSITHPIYGINLIEDLLFWTDNRNQPRKINVEKAIENISYYTNEDQISVAKYYPYKAPQLWEEVCISNITTTGSSTTFVTTDDTKDLRAGMALAGFSNTYIKFVKTTSPYSFTLTRSRDLGSGVTSACFIETSSKDVTQEYLTPSIFTRVTDDTQTSTLLPVYNPSSEILDNMQITCPGTGAVRTITNVTTVGSDRELTLSPSFNSSQFPDGALVTIAWPNPNYVSSWPGDEDYLSDKFVRFAYRFKYDDGEYSVISPFTQPAFIPNNNGYIPTTIPEGSPTTTVTGGDPVVFDALGAIANSTILAFFENKVQQVKIKIPLPYAQNELEDKLKVSEIQILYKESDGLAIQILEEVKAADFDSTDTSEYYVYNYQSRRPFRVLPERETLRVYDKVPIRALSQSVVGNRVIYGNFIDKHSPPVNLTYSVAVSEKYRAEPANSLKVGTSSNYSSNCSMAYPIHTVKQNRTYQVGIVLADKYGRQSDVILSSITDFQQSPDGGTTVFDGSTVYAPYSKGRISSSISGYIQPEDWLGNSLKVLFSGGGIPETSTNEGYPGLYKSGKYTGTLNAATTASSIISLTSLDPNIAVGNIVTGIDTNTGAFVDSIKSIDTSTNDITVNNDYTIAVGSVITIYGPENKLGWYSYKIVVKQLAEEYYNAFLGGFTTILENAKIQAPAVTGQNRFPNTFATTLISDNVNKIPADLGTVAPEQNQFGTSDKRLNILIGGDNDKEYPHQFYFGTSTAGISGYGKVLDLGLSTSDTVPATAGLFASGSNPPSIITQGSNNETYGVTQPDSGTNFKFPIFSVVEIEPPVSRLEIYWETSTAGLVSELNEQIATGSTVDPILPDNPTNPSEPVTF